MVTKLIAVNEGNYKWLNDLRIVFPENKKVESFSSVITRIRATLGATPVVDKVIEP